MKVMIVGAGQELQQELAAWIPISPSDQVIEASGMLSALWYAETQHPDLIVLDMLPPDGCGRQLEELLRRSCPDAKLLGNLQESRSLADPRPEEGRRPASPALDMAAGSAAFA